MANSAIAIKCMYPEKSIEECTEEAKISIENKGALQAFKTLNSLN